MCQEQQILQEIYHKMEVFKQSSSSGRRQYLSAASVLCNYDRRLSEIFNSDEDIDIIELKEMNDNVDKILKNLGIV